MLDAFEDVFGQRAFDGDALHEAGAVAQDGEDDLAGFAEVIEPAGDLNGFAVVGGDLRDGDSWIRFLCLFQVIEDF